MRRRTLLSSFTVALAAVAGCTSPGGTEDMTDDETTAATQTPDEPSDDPATTSETTEPNGGTTTDDTGGGTDDTGGGSDELDLREANVMGVSLEQSGSDYRFSVTLLHDDDGEDGYANWWVVESLDGTELGRRELLHAHGTQEFTRSETIAIPEETTCVVVRGHDQTHGYGGQAMLVNLETGTMRTERQGSEPKSFADATC
ncbi:MULTISPECIES: hypothetical protein [Haloferax]|uniref:Lipoprotein n=1 Tax=Haloferax marinum TaxID=2666143 RepID=A0A6A8G3J5_9EURY|nr:MULTISPECIES: hypothetical protein [Haloferax]KAB1195998.1 hypothetical protein Hfx1150_00085 [Haloferax sp. CBA1150]MRW94973.1 hypothetical protein [Haloferax marinum]